MYEICVIINRYSGFNMASVFVGTGYNQVVQFQTNDKHKTRTLFGTLARAPVKSINLDPANDRLIYATAKNISGAYSSGETQEMVVLKSEESILRCEYIHPHAFVRYCLSNGSVHCVAAPSLLQSNQEQQDLRPETLFLGEKHSKFTYAAASSDRERFLFCGWGVVPIVCNLALGGLDWYGKNVKNDELDLQVPIKDVDAAFLGDQKSIAILHADRKLRIYDIRGTHRRPVKDISLGLTEKSQMTRMRTTENQFQYYFSNDVGEVFKCDSRKDWKPTGKFKGITASITDFQLTRKALYAASLDSYVHIFDLQSTKLIKKVYLNKPAYCIRVEDEQEEESNEEQGEVELELQEEEAPKKPEKLKQIRKRNKVGLKYLQPREFDEPTEIKMEQVRQKEWYQDLNPIDRKQFEQ